MEIKFRGKSIESKEWIYGDLLQINNRAYIYPHDYGDLSDVDFGVSFVEVEPKTVGQLIDTTRFNKDVYSGDIIISWQPRTNTSAWNTLYNRELHSWLIVIGKNTSKYEGKIRRDVGFNENIPDELIGNIVDNPELLEG